MLLEQVKTLGPRAFLLKFIYLPKFFLGQVK